MPTKGFPELQELYTLLGSPRQVMLARGEQFPHNYNAVSRVAFYTWLNQHFKLVAPKPRDRTRLRAALARPADRLGQRSSGPEGGAIPTSSAGC